MKTIIPFIFCCTMLLLASCRKEEKLDPNSVVIDQAVGNPNALDKYILNQYTLPYNIDITYKFVDVESDQNYNLSPANFESSIRMTRLIQHFCIEPYDVITGSKEHIKTYFPKILNYIGSPAYRNNGTIVLGTAEGGRKITMYLLNELTASTASDVEYLNFYYFHTIHHEFAHIHNQIKPYSPSFKEISGPDYIQDSWSDIYDTDEAAAADGFVSPYASKEDREDFVEVMSYYITLSAEDWDARISAGGDEGKAIINQKLDIVKKYYEDSWNIDLDDLRAEILSRQSNLENFDQLDIE